MLRIKRLLSLFLAISVLAVSLPVSSILLLALNTEVSYVIWDANPLNVTEEEGATAKPTWDSYLFGSKTTGQSAVRYGGEMPYYELTFTGSGTANGALISSGFKYYWYNDKLGFTGWISHRSVLEAIKPYLYISYEVYVEDGTDNVSLTVQPQPKWGGDPTSDYGTFDEYENIPSGEWIERTVPVKEILHSADGNPHWSDAAVLISIDKEGVSAETPVKVSIRKLCLEIREEDREEVNSALAEVENIDKLSWFTGNYNGSSTVGDFPKQESGVLDYFEGLATYDAHSEYSPNLQTNNITDASTDENGTIKLSTYRTKAGNTVTVTAEPADGYRVKEIKAEDTDGDRAALVRTGPLTYSFVMPNSALTVTAVFESETAIEDKEYVIWDANPVNLPEGSDGLAGKSGWINNKFSGSAEIKEDEDGAYYSLTVNDVGEAGMAGLFSGLIKNDGRMSGWQDDRVFVNALMQYATMSFEARRTDENSSTGVFEAGMASAWGGWDSARFGTIENSDALNTERNVWHSYSYSNLDEETTDMVSDSAGDHWSSGAFRFGAVSGNISEENPAMIDIRRMKLTLSEKDRLAFNQYLADIDYVRSGGWDWNNDFTPSLDVNGNPDYFAQLIKYDELSEYSTNTSTHSIYNDTSEENGNINISKTRAKANQLIEITVFPNAGYSVASLKVTDTAGKETAVTRTGEKTYTFLMPDADVIVMAEFILTDEMLDKTYVIWDANPDNLPDGSDGLADKNGWCNKEFSGSSELVTEGNDSFFRLTFDSTQESGMAVLLSGYKSANDGTGFGWLSDRTLLDLIIQYSYMKFDLRRSDTSLAEPSFEIGMAEAWSSWQSSKFGVISSDSEINSERNEWHSYYFSNLDDETGTNVSSEVEDHWQYGTFRFGVLSGIPDGEKVTVDIANVRLELCEADRLAFNRYLACIGYTPSGAWEWNDAVNKAGTDSEGNKDIFELLIRYDSKSAYSPNYTDHFITDATPDDAHGSIELSRTAARPNEKVTLTVNADEGYELYYIIITDSLGRQTVIEDFSADSASFKMSNDNVTVTAYFKEATDKLTQLFMAEPVSDNESNKKQPSFAGVTEVVYDKGETAWKFTFDEDAADIVINGFANQLYYKQVPADAEITFAARVNSGSKKLSFGSNGSQNTKSVIVTEEYQYFTVTAKDLFTDIPEALKFTLADANEGDVLYITEIYLWNEPTNGRTTAELFEELYDISDYPVEESQTQIGIIGDPDSDVAPWEENYNGEEKITGWTLAWFEPFRGESPWYVAFQTDTPDRIYRLAFYHNVDPTYRQEDMTPYIEHGYLEFYVKCETDGAKLPLTIESSGGTGSKGKVTLPLRVVYSKENARPDGYMAVRVPLVYLYSMGIDLDCISVTKVCGIQPSEDFYLSAFRFWSNRAPEQPEPEEVTPEEPVYSFSFDPKRFSGKIDNVNMTVSVPAGTYIWELLSGIVFSSDKMTVAITDQQGRYYLDDSLLLQNGMMLTLRHNGYDYDSYRLIVPDIPGNSQDNQQSDGSQSEDELENTGNPDNEEETTTVVYKKKKVVKKSGSGEINILPYAIGVSAGVLVAVAAVILILVRKKRRTSNNLH